MKYNAVIGRTNIGDNGISITIDNITFTHLNELLYWCSETEVKYVYMDDCSYLGYAIRLSEWAEEFYFDGNKRKGFGSVGSGRNGINKIVIDKVRFTDLKAWKGLSPESLIEKYKGDIPMVPSIDVSKRMIKCLNHNETDYFEQLNVSMLDLKATHSHLPEEDVRTAKGGGLFGYSGPQKEIVEQVFQYDMHSFYPWLITNIHLPYGDSFVETDRTKIKDLMSRRDYGYIGKFWVEFSNRRKFVKVAMLRKKSKNLAVFLDRVGALGGAGYIYATKNDINNLLMQYGKVKIRAVEVSFFEIKPLSEIAPSLYNLFLELAKKKEALPKGVDRDVIKLQINSMIGLMGKNLGELKKSYTLNEDGEIIEDIESGEHLLENWKETKRHGRQPYIWDPRWNAWVVSAGRLAMMNVQKMVSGRGLEIIHMHTDSFTTTDKLPGGLLEMGPGMGQWDLEQYDYGVFWRANAYALYRGDTLHTAELAKFAAGNIEEEYFELWLKSVSINDLIDRYKHYVATVVDVVEAKAEEDRFGALLQKAKHHRYVELEFS